MNKDLIKQALNCLAGNTTCNLCPYNDFADEEDTTCINLVCQDALELISQQETEIYKLKKQNSEIIKNLE